MTDFDRRLDDRIRADLGIEYPGYERIMSVVTDTVPARFPGRFVAWIGERAPTPTDPSALLDAAVAIECTVLHQYLHSIPGSTGELIAPAANSPYPGDPRTAILDGDFVQARAFTLLAGACETADARLECYRLLAVASMGQYASTHRGRDPDRDQFMARVGEIGAILGGMDAETRKHIRGEAGDLGSHIPMISPTTAVRPTHHAQRTTHRRLVELEQVLPNCPDNPLVVIPSCGMPSGD